MPASNVKLIKGSDLQQWRADKERKQVNEDDREDEHLVGHWLGVFHIITKDRPKVRAKIIARINRIETT